MPYMEATDARRTRILVIDDEPTITEFLETGLRYEGYEVLTLGDGAGALAAVQSFQPDVVILDIMLPGQDGFSICRQLHALDRVAILMLTARDDLDDKVRGLDEGADDYLAKPFKFKELLARLRVLLRRRSKASTTRLRSGPIELDRDTREVWHAGVPVHLTPREFELLETFMLHPRQVFSRETLLNRVWGYAYIGDTNVVEVHISALREKLGDHERQWLQTVRGVGYMLRG
jgi:DNA-binding response OmpR family regulator